MEIAAARRGDERQVRPRPAVVAKDNACEFGCWLHGPDLAAAEKNGPHYQKVRELHASFHAVAADVVRNAVSGKRAEAEASLAARGAFDVASTQLTGAMMAWKKALV